MILCEGARKTNWTDAIILHNHTAHISVAIHRKIIVTIDRKTYVGNVCLYYSL